MHDVYITCFSEFSGKFLYFLLHVPADRHVPLAVSEKQCYALMLVNSLSSEEFRKNGRGIAMFLTDGKGNVPVSGDMKEEIEELSTELGKTSDVYIVHSSRGSQRFLPTFNDTIARCSGGRIINIAELEHQIRIGV